MGDAPFNPPDAALEALARCLYPMMLSYFESEEGRREFAEWQAATACRESRDTEQCPESVGGDAA